jgi:hypothetical protein
MSNLTKIVENKGRKMGLRNCCTDENKKEMEEAEK